MGTGVAHSV